MTDLLDLERRVSALEKAQKDTAETQTWMASTLGRIAAVQEQHTQRLERIEHRLDSIETYFRRDLPTVIADTMRQVMKDRG